MTELANKRILLGVTGGIAAYKSAELLRRLQDQGASVRVVMTQAATEFITPLTMQALSQHPVHLDLLSTETESAMGHIELARWADLILVAPATADFIARFVAGRSDDLLTAICLAANCQLAVAPAMNQAMWSNPATQSNLAAMQARGVQLFAPGEGIQACGEVGEGRLMEVPDLVAATCGLFPRGLLAGKTMLVTAGPTREAIDPVRYISNHSSGKQGYALAEAGMEAGAKVTLVSGPTSLAAPPRVELVPVVSAQEMLAEVQARAAATDVFIGVAAVADYRPVQCAQQKIKKAGNNKLTLELEQNPDILARVAALEPGPFTVGFAAETNNLVDYAKGKLHSKRLDMIIANNVAEPGIGFNADENETTVITAARSLPLPRMSKQALARQLITLIAEAVNQ